MLVATPLNCTDIDSFAAELLRMFRYMSGIGFKINDMNTMGLVLEPLDPQEEPEPLQVQLERLPCSMEARWEILRVLTEFETYLRELTELLRPVAGQLAAEMQALTERNRAAGHLGKVLSDALRRHVPAGDVPRVVSLHAGDAAG